jgi:ankyrin repeat protein
MSVACCLPLPQLPSISEIFKKMPLPVQKSVIDCLQQIAQQEVEDVDRRANAFFNLAVAYVNGYGIASDLAKAAESLLTAAGLGLQKAQMLYIDIFQNVAGAEPLGRSQEFEWLKDAVRGGDRRALSRIESSFPSEYMAEKDIFWCTESIGKLDHEASSDMPQAWTDWRQMFLRFAVIHELRDLVELQLSFDETLINKRFRNGETPLLLASRMGNAAMATFLVSKGADPTLKMGNGVTPLHWLIAFDPADKESVAALYVDHRAELNAMADLSGGQPFRRTIFETPINGTPLHWAVAENDTPAMDALLSLGADSTVRTFTQPPLVGLSCLELAASLSRSAIARRLLLVSAVQEEAGRFRRLDQTAAVMVQPLFHVLRMTSRWDRLLSSGAGFERQTQETMQLLIENGAPTDAVLQFQDVKMSAAFTTTYHHCNADILRTGLELGFRANIDSTFGRISSGGNALMLAITHQDREMFDVLMDAGADVNAADQFGCSPLHRVAKETDNVYFASRLLAAGAELEPSSRRPSMPGAFYFAVHAGHFEVASFLFEKGANRDYVCPDRPITILGDMIHKRTMNAVKRVEYLLTLPDRGSDGDGFIVNRPHGWPVSAFHTAVSAMTENPVDNEITRAMISPLMSKYRGKSYLDSTDGPHHSCVLAMATEVGNHQVVRELLEAGADPNIQDEYGRTALDLLYWRYYYPALTVALQELEDISDRMLVGRILRYVNENTEDLLALLTSYGARTSVFSPPVWAESSPGLRSLDWVMQQEQQPGNPWGNLPIRIPERPMQFNRAPPVDE